jgi:hypothetical protein
MLSEVSWPAFAETNAVFTTAHFIEAMRDMIGKPMLDVTIDYNNKSRFILEALTPEGARFFYGGNNKDPGESADNMRQNHKFIIILTPCVGTHELSGKISSAVLWETLDSDEKSDSGLGLEQLLAMMNTPAGVVTPSTLRVPKAKGLRGPVFEYVRGDTTEILSFVNEGSTLRVNWSTTNLAICPR